MSRLSLALALLAAFPAAADVQFRPVDGQEHIAELVLQNHGTIHQGERVYRFQTDEGEIVVIENNTPNGMGGCCDDFFGIQSMPPHLQADTIETMVPEGQGAVVRIYQKVMG